MGTTRILEVSELGTQGKQPKSKTYKIGLNTSAPAQTFQTRGTDSEGNNNPQSG